MAQAHVAPLRRSRSALRARELTCTAFAAKANGIQEEVGRGWTSTQSSRQLGVLGILERKKLHYTNDVDPFQQSI